MARRASPRRRSRRWLTALAGAVARVPRIPRGQSLVEFALVLPVMLILLAGALDLGRVFYANISLDGAAREGALQAARTPDSFIDAADCDQDGNLVVCRVQMETRGSMTEVSPGDIELACSVSGCPAQAGSTVTVTVRGTFRLLTPLLAAVFGGTDLPITSSATAQIEYLPPANTATAPPGPVASFTADDTTGTDTLTVQFTDTSTGPATQWQWDFGDGTTSIEQNPSHEYTAPGDYTVTLTAINLTGVDIEVKASYIEVQASPTPTPEGTPSPTPSPTVAPTPSCVYIPNVIGASPSTAQALLVNAGFIPDLFGALSTGTKGKIQAQHPDHTQCQAAGTHASVHYRPS